MYGKFIWLSEFKEVFVSVTGEQQKSHANCLAGRHRNSKKNQVTTSVTKCLVEPRVRGECSIQLQDVMRYGSMLAGGGERSFHNCISNHVDTFRSDSGDVDFKISDPSSPESEELFQDVKESPGNLSGQHRVESDWGQSFVGQRKKKLSLRKWSGSSYIERRTVSCGNSAVRNPSPKSAMAPTGKASHFVSQAQSKNMASSAKKWPKTSNVCQTLSHVSASGLRTPGCGDVKGETGSGLVMVVPETDSSDDFESISPSQNKCNTAVSNQKAELINLVDSCTDDDWMAGAFQLTDSTKDVSRLKCRCTRLIQSKLQLKKSSQVKGQTGNYSKAVQQDHKVSQITHQNGKLCPEQTTQMSHHAEDRSQVSHQTKYASRMANQTGNKSEAVHQDNLLHVAEVKVKRKDSATRHFGNKCGKRLKLSTSAVFSSSDSDSFIILSDSDEVIYRPKKAPVPSKFITDRIKSFNLWDESDSGDVLVVAKHDDALNPEARVKNFDNGFTEVKIDSSGSGSDSLLSPKKQVAVCVHGSLSSLNIDVVKVDATSDSESDSLLSPKNQISSCVHQLSSCLNRDVREVDVTSDAESDSLLTPQKQVTRCVHQTFSSHNRVSPKLGVLCNSEDLDLPSSQKQVIVDVHKPLLFCDRDAPKLDVTDIKRIPADQFDCKPRGDGQTRDHLESAHKNGSDSDPQTEMITSCYRGSVIVGNKRNSVRDVDEKQTSSSKVVTEAGALRDDTDDYLGTESPFGETGLDSSTAVTSTPTRALHLEKDGDKHLCSPGRQAEALDASACSYSQVDISDAEFTDNDDIFASLMQSDFKLETNDKNEKKGGDDEEEEEDVYDEWTDEFVERIDTSFQVSNSGCNQPVPITIIDHLLRVRILNKSSQL